MNLAWIVAVLRPLDIAPHPNFNDPKHGSLPYAQLAGIVSGDPHRSRISTDIEGEAEESDQGVRYAAMSLTNEGILEGLNGLVQEVLQGESTDRARRSALGLLACCAAAELEEYGKCDAVLQFLLRETPAVDPESKLVRAALLQQQCLRFRDSGRSYESQTDEVLRLLQEVDGFRFSDFTMSPGATVSPSECLQFVVDSLRQAAWSLVPMRSIVDESDRASTLVPTWKKMVRTSKSNQALKIDQARASEYSKFLEDAFARMFRSQARNFGGRGAPTLFYASLNFELLGDFSVYRLRKENALMKLVQCMSAAHPDANDVSDALRLLRHSNAKAEIDLTVERIRASGPLEALRNDAMQILRNRTDPQMWRAAELRVINATADLMSQGEALSALTAVRQVIEAGGAHVAPGSSQLKVVRLEAAWIAASRLANFADEDDQIASLLLEAARDGRPGDELWDKAIGRSLKNLNWGNVSTSGLEQWRSFLNSSGSRMDASKSVFEALADRQSTSVGSAIEDLEDVANRVNAVINGAEMSAAEVATSVEIVRESLIRIKEEASGGVYAFRMLDSADVAAALIAYAGVVELWDSLAEFFADRQIQRSDKSAALDRLSFEVDEVPQSVMEVFRQSGATLLEAPIGPFEGGVVTPFPAALRFLSVHQIIGEMEAFSLIARMSGSGDAETREEASRTVAILSSRMTSSWLISQAMQFSHDLEPSVRAHAARALALFSSSSSEFGSVAGGRLEAMMQEEGILVPLLVIRQMRRNGAHVLDSARWAVASLVVNHPSATVRREAQELLAEVR
ncbi:hypothetical protein [Streptomyces goshikiensis]|uniref:hypothetical protein n=1 Tax=Streptomyces goshikiensis TaxID=1942 RepID=UPI002E0E4D5E|nr:hypothetical protein OG224_13425 [Streptomyces goshikiensis]